MSCSWTWNLCSGRWKWPPWSSQYVQCLLCIAVDDICHVLWSPAYTRVTVSPVTPAVSKFFFHWGLKQQRVSSEEVSLCTTVSCSCEYQQTWWRQGPGDSRPQQDPSGNLILHTAGTHRTHAKGKDEGSVWVHFSSGMLSRPAAPPCCPHPQPVSHSFVESTIAVTREAEGQQAQSSTGTSTQRGCQDGRELLSAWWGWHGSLQASQVLVAAVLSSGR